MTVGSNTFGGATFGGTLEYIPPVGGGLPIVGNVRAVKLRTYVRKRNRVNNIELDDATVEYLEIDFVSRNDPTGYVVEFQITDLGEDVDDGNWIEGEWSDDSPQSRGEKFFSKGLALVGSAGLELDIGSFQLWIRVQGDNDTPVKKAGTLVVS